MTNVVLTRPPGADTETLEEYEALGGWKALRTAVTTLSQAEVVDLVSRSGLRGKGGAGFPTGAKWELARASLESPKYVLANGGEHEPGSLKDRLIVSTYPHKVLEGIALCAYATGASIAYIYLIEGMADAARVATAAISEAAAAGHLGERIHGTGFSLEIRLAVAPSTYVAGEETAALEVIEGRRAWPRKKPPYPGQSGLFGQPTTVNNLETLAHAPAIVRYGPQWYSRLGVVEAAGTMLFTLDERFVRPGVHEVPMGQTFRRLIYDIGGGPRSGRPVRGIHPALSSPFLPAGALDLPLTYRDLKKAGSSLGCGTVSVLDEGECVVERLVAISEFFMQEQCGQCPPCRMETGTLAAVMKQVRDAQAGDYAGQIDRITSFTRGKGFCSLIEMAASPVLSALRLFPEDFAHHAAHGSCR